MLTDLLVRYGYAMVFVAAAIEGDATLVTATFLAHRGYLQLDWVIIVSGTATVAINQVYYWLGRGYGQARVDAMRTHRVYGRVIGWVTRYGFELVVASRFIYGFRIAIPATCGATGMSPILFLIGDVFSASVWATVVGLAGYLVGHVLELVIHDLHRHEGTAALAVLLIALALLARRGRDWPFVRIRRRTPASE